MYAVLVLKGSDSEFFLHVWDFGTSQAAYSKEPIEGRLWKLIK